MADRSRGRRRAIDPSHRPMPARIETTSLAGTTTPYRAAVATELLSFLICISGPGRTAARAAPSWPQSRRPRVRTVHDIGTVIPTSPTVHAVAREADPSARASCRLRPGRAGPHKPPLASDPWVTAGGPYPAARADRRSPGMHAPDEIVTGGLLFAAVLDFAPERGGPGRDRARSGSASRGQFRAGSQFRPPDTRPRLGIGRDAVPEAQGAGRTPSALYFRSRDQITRLLDGLELLEPGVVTAASGGSGRPRHRDPPGGRGRRRAEVASPPARPAGRAGGPPTAR